MEREQAIRLMQDLLRRMSRKKGSDLFIPPAFHLRSRSTGNKGLSRTVR